MSIDVQGTFVSQKINKVRWIPEEYVDTKSFLTGSWDDDDNSVKVWSFERANEEEDAEYPRQLSEYKVDGDVTDIKFVEKNRIAVSVSNGDVLLLEISNYEKETPLRQIYLWKSLHKLGNEPCPTTCLDALEGDVASVGEDGALIVLNCRRMEVTRRLSADSCSLHAVCFLNHHEIITGNIRGHMKIWDLRIETDKPVASFLLRGDELAATCLTHHPTQPHIVLAGSEAGALAVWDLRLASFPTSLVNAHSAAITDMQFHPENPQKLLSCSTAGELWDWNMECMTQGGKGPNDQTAWIPLNDTSNMMVNSLMPGLHKAINGLDCDRGRILCGADNEAIYLIKNFKY